MTTKTTIKLPCYGITVFLTGDGGGSITSELHENSEGSFNDPNNLQESEDERKDIEAYNNAINGIESMILGHACAGLDITSPEYVEGIESAVQGCAGNSY